MNYRSGNWKYKALRENIQMMEFLNIDGDFEVHYFL